MDVSFGDLAREMTMRSDLGGLVWRWAIDSPKSTSALAGYRMGGWVTLQVWEETSDFGCIVLDPLAPPLFGPLQGSDLDCSPAVPTSGTYSRRPIPASACWATRNPLWLRFRPHPELRPGFPHALPGLRASEGCGNAGGAGHRAWSLGKEQGPADVKERGQRS